MAQLILSGHEIISILQANGCIPQQIMDIAADKEEIRLRVRTDWPILKSVRVGMKFAGFDNGCIVLQLATNLLTDKFNWLADRMIEPLRLQEHGSRWEYPRLYIDVNELLQRQLRGVVIENVVVQDGLFHITTAHANSTSHNGDLQGQEGGSDPHAAPP